MKIDNTIIKLKNIYDDITKNNINDLTPIIKDIINIDVINNILETNKDKVSKKQIKYIRLICKLLKVIYDESSLDYTLITDDMYDKCINFLNSFDIDITGSKASKKLYTDTEHTYPELKGTTDKVKYVYNKDIGDNEFNVSTLEDFFNKVIGKSNKNKIEVAVSLKYDGQSCITDEKKEIIQALTRGDNGLGADITHIVKPLREYQKGLKKQTGVKNEIILSKSNLAKYNKLTNSEYKNTRSAINSILNKPEFSYLLTLVPIDYIDKEKTRKERLQKINKIFYNKIDFYYKIFNEKPNIMLKTIKAFYDLVLENRHLLTYDIDGLVIEFLDENIRAKMGRKNDINKYEIALKFPSEIRKSRVIDIVTEVGNGGTITPIVYYEPVTFSNNSTHRKSSISSYGKYKELGLRKNDIVEIKYVNDVICQVFKINDLQENINNINPIIEFPKTCPECGELLSFSDKKAKCINPQCKSLLIGDIIRFIEVFDIINVKEKVIEKLMDNGIISNVHDLLNIKDKESDILNLEGFGVLTYENIKNQIDMLMNREIFDYQFLASLNIPDIKTSFKKICKYYTIDDLFDKLNNNTLNETLIDINGIGEKKANKITTYFILKRDYISQLRKYFKIKNYKSDNNDIGLKIRISGFRLDKEYILSLQEKGIDISDGSVTKDTNYLIIPFEDYKSSKVTKAIKYNIPIIIKDKMEELY